jgi:hypothetical protein
VDSIDGDGVRLARARERRAADAERRGGAPAWIVPLATDREPNPPFSYVVSFVRHHERGFAAPASRFMRGLCYHYGVELHNFAPQRDLWIHLFRAELHTIATIETRVRRAVRAGGLTFSVRDLRKE